MAEEKRGVPENEWIMQPGDKRNHLTMVSSPFRVSRGESRQWANFKCDCGKQIERKCGEVSRGLIKSCGWECPIAHGHTQNGLKKCVKCGAVKSVQEFIVHCAFKDGLYSSCNDCKDDLDLMRVYGIGLQEYKNMLQLQNGVCAICDGGITGKTNYGQQRKRFCVDHDHKTNKVRGLLCVNCNTAIGLLKENAYILNRAIHYLETSR